MITFAAVVSATPSIKDSLRRDLDALSRGKHSYIRADNLCKITGSINLDDALRRTFPNQNRWDYGIGIKPTKKNERVDWIEFHSACSGHDVDKVFRKFYWLKQWINQYAPLFFRMHPKYIWIASGKVSFRPGTPQRIRISNKGIILIGNQYIIKP